MKLPTIGEMKVMIESGAFNRDADSALQIVLAALIKISEQLDRLITVTEALAIAAVERTNDHLHERAD